MRNKWSSKEAKRISSLLVKKTQVNKMNKIVYWISLLVLVICNLAISLFLIPFLLIMEQNFVYIIVSVLGLIFGLLFNFLIHNIEDLEHKHHVTAMILVPLLAIINLYIVVTVSNNIDKIIKIDIQHNPLLIAGFYVLFFVIPYFITEVKRLSH